MGLLVFGLSGHLLAERDKTCALGLPPSSLGIFFRTSFEKHVHGFDVHINRTRLIVPWFCVEMVNSYSICIPPPPQSFFFDVLMSSSRCR